MSDAQEIKDAYNEMQRLEEEQAESWRRYNEKQSTIARLKREMEDDESDARYAQNEYKEAVVRFKKLMEVD